MSFETVEDRRCEANKKVNYRQRGAIETRKHKKDVSSSKLEVLGSSLSFNFSNGEVIESALFDKTVRNCRGEEMRVEPVRRFRKIGSDEWFSIPASTGNDFWGSRFDSASDQEAIEQQKINEEASGEKSIDSSVVEKEDVVSVTKSKELTPVSVEKKESFLQKNKGWIMFAILATGAVMSYKYFNKK